MPTNVDSDNKSEDIISEDKKQPSIFNRAKTAIINAVDQNTDGSFNLEDVSILTNNVGTAAKNAAVIVKQNAKQSSDQFGGWLNQTRRDMELRTLRPLFEEDLDTPEFSLSKLIRVINMDKKHAESELCKGSIGFRSEYKGMNIINIYPENTDVFGLTFYPEIDEGVYYVNPCDRNNYIVIDDYFHYMKVARVNELQRIAQDLGAKYFKVTYKETDSSISKEKAAINLKQFGNKAGIEGEHKRNSSNSYTIEVSAEMACIGHEPVAPKLIYYKKDESIQNLIKLRLSDNTVKHQKYTLYCSQSSGIREADAVKIDSVLKAMRYGGKISLEKEAQSEARRLFEYEIDF